MSIPNHSITPILAADLPSLAQFIYASNLPQPTNQFLFSDWPNESAQISLYLAGMEQAFKDPHNEMYKVINDVSGDIIASLILTRKTPPGVNSPASANAETPSDPVGVNPEFRALLKRTLAEVQREMAGIDHFVLSSIFVKPGSRNRGMGSQLVRLCQDKAVATRLPLFLSSVPSAHGFYRKLGFVDTVHVDIDLSEWGPEYGGFGVYRLQGMLAPE